MELIKNNKSKGTSRLGRCYVILVAEIEPIKLPAPPVKVGINLNHYVSDTPLFINVPDADILIFWVAVTPTP